VVVLAATSVLWAPHVEIAQPSGPPHKAAEPGFGKLPLYFVENRGQFAPDVAFHVEGARQDIRFRDQGITYILPEATPSPKLVPLGLSSAPRDQTRRVDLRFVDANPEAHPLGRFKTGAAFHYYLGGRDQWKEDVPAYRKVAYSDLWPGIDLVYSTAPGELKVETPAGSFDDAAPVAFQEIAGTRHAVHASYDLSRARGPATAYGFRLGAYDRNRPLTIDPSVVVYAGYLGGFRNDEGKGIALDSEGAAYIVGTSASLRAGPPQGGPPPTDAFAIKINAANTELVYAVRLGGDEEDRGLDIVVDDEGSAYIAGTTSSTESSFPLKAGFDMTYGGGFRDAYVMKLDPNGLLSYSSYIGGSETDDGLGIAIDSDRSAYVAGQTRSTEANGFPVSVGPTLTHAGSADAFITKVSAAGDAIVFSGYLGGASRESALDVAVDRHGNAYLTGETFTNEQTFPVAVGPDLTYGGGPSDGFLAKVRSDGTGLLHAGYIRSLNADQGEAIAVDGEGNAFVAGSTFSTELQDFSVTDQPGPFSLGGSDAFIAKFTTEMLDRPFEVTENGVLNAAS